MLTTINKYPFFDISEIIPDAELEYRNYRALAPVRAGNYIPEFSLNLSYEHWQQFYNGSETHGPVLLRHLLDKPLVISFYSHRWKNLGVEYLKQLDAIQYEVKASGGNLLIVTSEQDEELSARAWEHNLSLNFYYDEDNVIAKHFRVYSDEDPAWNRFSGIDENAPLLATYVIDSAKRVIFDHVDLNFTSSFPSKNIISAVYQTALNNNRRRSA